MKDKKNSEAGFLYEKSKTKHASKMLEYLIMRTDLAYIELNTELKIVKWNSSAEIMFGYSGDEACNRFLSDLVTPVKEREKLLNFLSDVLSHSNSKSDTAVNLDSRGNEINCEWHYVPIYNDDNKISGISLISQDITHTVKAEEAFELYRRNDLQNIFKNAPIGIYQANLEGRFINVNSELAWILGYESSQMLVEEITDMASQLFVDKAKSKEFFFCLFEAEQLSNFKSEIRRKDGFSFWALLSAQITHNKNGRPDGFYGFFIDINNAVRVEEELKKAKEIAEAATQAKSDFLANMSHEIRTPLNAIIGFTALVLKSGLNKRQLSFVNKVQISSKALLGIINDVLDFSKIEAGMMEIEKVDFLLTDILDNLADMFASKVKEKAIELIISLAPDVPTALVGDSLRLGQILINLINNAIKFTDSGEIAVWASLVSSDSDQVEINFTVSDTGLGMTSKQQLKLFSSFTQADTSTTRKYGGTGLGLSISKKLVEMMNGKIWVQSESGMGSTFGCTLKFGLQDKEKNIQNSIPDDLKDMHILVIDKNEASREVIMMQLMCFSFNVQTTDSGEKMLNLLDSALKVKRPYKLVIINQSLLEDDGIKVVESIREWEVDNLVSDTQKSITSKSGSFSNTGICYMKTMPVIMTTDFGQDEIQQQAKKIGVTAFIVKPIKQTELLNVIMDVFGHEPYYKSELKKICQDDSCITQKIKGAKVLLVEDNEINQEVATETLKQHEISVDIANNGEEALKKIKMEGVKKNKDGKIVLPYDVVLMDIQMPEMDGYEATREIRLWEKEIIQQGVQKISMPIIAMSAHAISTEIEKCVTAGMNDYVSKPIDPKLLFSMLAKWIKPEQRDIKSVQKVDKTMDKELIIPDHMPGIDITSGLEKISNNKILYKKLLRKFYNTNKTIAKDIEDAFTGNRIDQAQTIVHTVKGVSGNLGALELLHQANNLEQAIKSNDKKLFEEKFFEFSKALDIVFGAIQSLPDPCEEKVTDHIQAEHLTSSFDITNVNILIAELKALIEDDIEEAKLRLAALKKKLFGFPFQAQLKQIEDSIEEYDIDAASEQLQNLNKAFSTSIKKQMSTNSGIKKQKILIVDDMSENIDILVELLKSDYKIVAARNGKKAIQIASLEQQPDLILLDVKMPGMDGFEVCKKLKSLEATKDIAIIFITAGSEVKDQIKGFELGAADYITKPIVPVIVKMRVKTQLKIKKQHDLLSNLSVIDGLTQIPNRRRFDDIIKREWNHALRVKSYLSLILMDIDHFKQFNDNYGHPAGDDCLKKVAKTLLRGCVRSTDLIARYGGEEFVAVLPGTDSVGAVTVADRIQKSLETLNIPHAYSSVADYVTISQGVVSVIPSNDMSVEGLIEHADQCLYHAKKNGRNRTHHLVIA